MSVTAKEILITKNGKVVAKLVNPHQNRVETARKIMGKLYSLAGILDITESDCIEALASPFSDYEDAVIEQVARRTRMKMKAFRGVGASLSPEEIWKWKTEHKRLLNGIAPEQFSVKHYVAMLVVRKNREESRKCLLF